MVFNHIFINSDNNETLSPRFEIDWVFMEQKIKEFVLRYNYTLNPHGVFEAVKFMYTFWPDPNNKTHIRDQYVHVRMFKLMPLHKLIKYPFPVPL
jgi:hypothetical protein